ncbi:MAG: primosomal protein N' [Gemmatimonadota bacterium]|nr:primosomal protein N' [Gemmatimonadota bacterium]
MTEPRFVEVALPLPVFQSFTYAVDDPPTNPLVPGTRVIVPVRRRRAVGICVGTPTSTAVKSPRAILEVPDAAPAFSERLLSMCKWMAQYYVVPLGLVLRSALPSLLAGAARPTPEQRTERIAVLTKRLPSLEMRNQTFGRAAKQRSLYELLESLGGRAPATHLLDHLDVSKGVLDELVKKQLVTIEDAIVQRDPFAARRTLEHVQHPPSAPQRAAIDALVKGEAGHVFLLHGVTGSGKTLVYIELLRQIVNTRNQTAIVLVPEIALTPQTVDRFRAVFGDQVAVLHSALSDGERYDAWLALKRGEKRIAVGARSAIFAPLENLGAVIVDEEHEGSYKNGETPRYHAREVAIVRAREEGAVVVLGSATPSLESWHNAATGKYRLLTLPERVGSGRMPAVTVVDLRRKPEHPPTEFSGVISPQLESAIGERLAREEQSILLLNRRGYASFVQCADCGFVVSCPNCSITLTYHRAPERLVCHYCRHYEDVVTTCIRCGGTTVRQRGLGTQQVERVLAERWPAARIARMDVDTTSGKWAHAEILDRVGRGEVEILLGTQMIAKGLDFPNVTLVGVVDADVGINFPDFRASERSFQLLSQVAGRAGRGPKGGAVIIQTRVPSHHAIRCALTHDYEAFVGEELPARRTPVYPPYCRVANVIVSGLAEEPTADAAIAAADWLRQLIASAPDLPVTVVGAAPCPIDRIKRRWRWHMLLKSDHQGSLTRVARYFLERFEMPSAYDMRVVVDRDPVSLL